MAFVEKTIFLSLFLVEVLVSAQREAGVRCGPGNSRVCLRSKDCPEAIAQVIATGGHTLEHCGWDGIDQIVCCTDTDTENPQNRFGTVRKSTTECMKYWKSNEVDYSTFIYHGHNSSLGEFPHIASLGYQQDADGTIAWGECGGSLISKNFVLTAAHCLFRSDQRPLVMVRLGKIDLFGDTDREKPQDIKVAKRIPHPNYKHFNKLNDIALLQLEKDAALSKTVRPICLLVNDTIPNNVGLLIAGWGQTEVSARSRILLHAIVNSVDLDFCNRTFLIHSTKKPLVESHLCAKSTENPSSDTCYGDSGGPIQLINRKANKLSPLIIVGVTSFGRGCGGPTPSVYTKVFNYLDWIEEIVWGN